MKDADKELLDDLATLNHYQKIKIEVYEERKRLCFLQLCALVA